MITFFTISVFVITLTVLYSAIKLFKNDPLREIPGPTGYPIIGNALEFWTTSEEKDKLLQEIKSNANIYLKNNNQNSVCACKSDLDKISHDIENESPLNCVTSYSNKVKTKSKTTLSNNFLLIKPCSSNQTPSNTYNDIKAAANPGNLSIAVNKIKTTTYGVLVNCDNPESIKILKDNLTNKIGVNYELSTPNQIWNHLRMLARKYYPIYIYRHMTYIPVVNIICPEDMKIILSSSFHITKSRMYLVLEKWLGTGLLTSTGKKWHQRRKLLTPAFHLDILQQFVDIFNKHSQLFAAKLENECGKSYTNVVPFVTDCTLHSICESAMGTALDEENEITREYVKTLYKLGELAIYFLVHPWCHYTVTAVFTPSFWQYKRLIGILRKFSNNIIKKRKQQFQKDNVKRKRMALLDLLILAQENDQNIDDEGIREEVDTFIFEGHDTTSACISFSMLLLACHQDVQEKVMEELRTIFEDSHRVPTFEDLQSMHYLDIVVKECLRFYPSVPLISRVTEKNVQTSQNYTIPKDTMLQLNIYDLHHNPDLFPEPEKFDPERFLSENAKNRDPFVYLPFSAGQRNCIGQKFAMLEVKCILSTILRKYVLLQVDTPKTIVHVVDFILRARDGIKIKFQPREINPQN
ncbi:hypothetical protein FQA39_LY08856 [Lamprigera yunnana]|nr:hypothetical protein FQA39_LY08856 [Lamprigera yunnana]